MFDSIMAFKIKIPLWENHWKVHNHVAVLQDMKLEDAVQF
jgi:hypothetical protein